MDSKTIDEAMKRKLPVMYDGRRHECISEYVLWYDRNGKRQLSVVLMQGNSVFRVPADKVELAKE